MRAAGLPEVHRVGSEWLTITEIAERCGLTPNAVRWRIKQRWKIEEVMRRPAYSGRARPGIPGGYYLNGKPVTQNQLAELAGISKGAMSKRLRKPGMTPEKAVELGRLIKPKP